MFKEMRVCDVLLNYNEKILNKYKNCEKEVKTFFNNF